MTRLVFDVEGNGFLEDVTRLHCICTIDVDTEEEREYGPDEIEEGVEALRSADVLFAHNGLRYDYPALEKLRGLVLPLAKAQDSLVLSRTIRPNIKETDSKANKHLLKEGKPGLGELFGSHSIEAWAFRLGMSKVGADITDYSVWTPEIQARCINDVRVNLAILRYLKPERYQQYPLNLEHRVARLCFLMEQAGWPFNEKAAAELHVKLVERRDIVSQQLISTFKGWVKETPFVPKRDNKSKGYVAGQTFIKKSFVEFNPGSRDHIARALIEQGWKPQEFTESGKPKLDEEVIESLAAQFPQSNGLVEYLMLEKRLGQLAEGKNAWLKSVTAAGRIHASYNTMGTITSRMSHFNPNIAQVPASASPYGKECRELFTVPEGWSLVGADMSGLELRALAHYMAKYDKGAYGEIVLSGDVHWANVLAMGLAEGERDKHNQLHTIVREQGAKRFIYAWLYGAGDLKIGRIILDVCRLAKLQCGADGEALFARFFDSEAPSERDLRTVGKRLKEEFLFKTPGVARLIQTVKEMVWEHNALPGLDKRRIPIRSDHAALNFLLQSCGAILCKQWIADAYDALVSAGFKHGWQGDFVFCASVHDEIQVACKNGLEEQVGQILVRTAQEAGKPFNFRIRLDGEFKVGKTWASTH